MSLVMLWPVSVFETLMYVKKYSASRNILEVVKSFVIICSRRFKVIFFHKADNRGIKITTLNNITT